MDAQQLPHEGRPVRNYGTYFLFENGLSKNYEDIRQSVKAGVLLISP